MTIRDHEQEVLRLYDELDYSHHGRMHRAGLVHLIATELDIPHYIVNVVVTEYYGPVDDAETDQERTIKNDSYHHPTSGSPEYEI